MDSAHLSYPGTARERPWLRIIQGNQCQSSITHLFVSPCTSILNSSCLLDVRPCSLVSCDCRHLSSDPSNKLPSKPSEGSRPTLDLLSGFVEISQRQPRIFHCPSNQRPLNPSLELSIFFDWPQPNIAHTNPHFHSPLPDLSPTALSCNT